MIGTEKKKPKETEKRIRYRITCRNSKCKKIWSSETLEKCECGGVSLFVVDNDKLTCRNTEI